MDLKGALRAKPGELIAFVGAGGKTTAAWKLLRLFVASGERAVFTTTTHIFEPQRASIILDPQPDPADIARALLIESPALILAADRGEKGSAAQAARCPYPALPIKLKGLRPNTLTELTRRLPGITWLVEADGAKGRPLKAPAEYEPVVPTGAHRVIIVAGLGALGQRLTEKTVHRPEIAARLLHVPLETRITPQLMAELIVHPSGGLKGIPPEATVAVLLTQQEAPPHPQATTLTQKLLLNNRISYIVLANLHSPTPVLKTWG